MTTFEKSSARDLQSDGWQWQRTRLTNPERAERHWERNGGSYAVDGYSWCRRNHLFRGRDLILSLQQI